MKKFNTMLVGSMLVASVMSHASKVNYDIGLAFESSAISGQASNSPENQHPGFMYGTPRIDLGVATKINGPVSAFARFSGVSGSKLAGFTPEVSIQSGRELQAMAGFAYDLGEASYSLAPVVSYASYRLGVDDVSEEVGLSAFGLNGSVDLHLAKVGVRFYTQYLVNNKFEDWGDTQISSKIGNLSTNVTKVGVGFFGDKQSFA